MDLPLGGNWIDSLSPHLAAVVRSNMRERCYVDGQPLFRQGDCDGSLFEVLRGQVNVVHCSANGEESLITVFAAGDCLGEQSLVDGLPRANTAFSRGPTTVRTLDRVTFGRLKSENREITEAMLTLISRRFRLALLTLGEQSEARPTHRVGRRLLTLAKAHGRQTPEGLEIDTWLSQGEFAQWVGLSRQRVNKALQDLQRDGIITLTSRRVTITSLETLKGRYA